MEQPNQLRQALARLEARRIEIEREIVDEIEQRYFADGPVIDLTDAIYNDPPLSQGEQAAWDAIITRF